MAGQLVALVALGAAVVPCLLVTGWLVDDTIPPTVPVPVRPRAAARDRFRWSAPSPAWWAQWAALEQRFAPVAPVVVIGRPPAAAARERVAA